MKNSFSALLSIGLILLAVAMAWLAYSIQGVTRVLPAVIAEVEEVNTRIDAIVAVILPVVTEVGMVRKMVPPILDEVAQISALIPSIVGETANIRRDVTPVLERIESVQAQVKEIQAILPMIAETVNHAADQVDKIIAESEELRRSVPITLTRVEAIVFDAGEVGAKATKGAVTGVVKGIIFSPFQLMKAAGDSITESLFSTREITDEDETHIVDAANQLLNNLELQSVNWTNPKSGNSGHVSLEKAFTSDGVQCVSLRFDLLTKSGHKESSKKVACLAEDGAWAIKE